MSIRREQRRCRRWTRYALHVCSEFVNFKAPPGWDRAALRLYRVRWKAHGKPVPDWASGRYDAKPPWAWRQ